MVPAEAIRWSLVSGRSDLSGRSNAEIQPEKRSKGGCQIIHHVPWEHHRLIVWASNGGSPTHPDWYHNLVAHPHVTVEVGTETFDAIAVVTKDAERNQLWTQGVAVYPQLAEAQAKTARQIPVIALSRQASGRP